MKLIHYEAGAPLYIWLTHKDFLDEQHMLSCLKGVGLSDNYSLAVFTVDDWNGAYSPWEASNPVDGSRFAGGGEDTRSQLWKELCDLENNDASFCSKRILVGYSLAGLFALWMGLDCKWINGIVCGSGSMWFEGFIDYLKTAELTGNKYVYLSLGGKEKRTSNQVMSTIEDRTREAVGILKNNDAVCKVEFELNAGGHFADSCKRLAGGMRWMREFVHEKKDDGFVDVVSVGNDCHGM